MFHLSGVWKIRLRRALGSFALVLFLGPLSLFLGRYLWAYHQLGSARAALEQGHNLAAIQHLQSCRQLLSEKPDWLILSAGAARRGGAWFEAETLLDQYWKVRGDDDALVLERLLLRATRGETEAVESQLRQRIANGGTTASLAREALVVGHTYRFNLAKADDEIEEWLSGEPDSPRALYLRGKLFEVREATDLALVAYLRCVELDPDYDEARLRLASLLVTTREGEKALPQLEFLKSRFPDNPEVLVKLAQALDLQQRESEARSILDDCLRRHPDYPDALTEHGRIALRSGESEVALEELRHAVARDPGNTIARYQFSLALKENGNQAEALREQEAIVRLEADIARLKEIIEGPLSERPNDPSVYHEIAVISLRAGKPKEALRWLNNALAVDPNYEPVHRSLAAYYYETGQPILSARHRAMAQHLAERKKP